MTANKTPASYRRAWAAGLIAFSAHNLEEVLLDLPAWTAAHPELGWLNWMTAPGAFAVAVSLLTPAVVMLGLFAMANAPAWGRAALTAFAVVMLSNAAAHLALSVATRSLMPGAVTAGVLIAPVFASVLWVVGRR